MAPLDSETPVTSPSDADYERLLALRTGLRQFDRWSAEQAKAAGLTPKQHQLMLAIRGNAREGGPTVGDAASSLLLQHHSAVGLVDRAVAAGLVMRVRDDRDHRVVHLRLTPEGEHRLESLSVLHLQEIARLAISTKQWEGLQSTNGTASSN